MVLKSELEEFYEIWHDIHAHLELKYWEFRTSKLIEKYLKKNRFL
jgi:metal-dependent amidase/aminoacylase/carboxypeptidase family protein